MTKRKNYSEDFLASAIAELAAQGATREKIATTLGRSYWRISKVCALYKIETVSAHSFRHVSEKAEGFDAHGKKQFAVRVPTKVYDAVKASAQASNVSVQFKAREILERWAASVTA